MRRRRQLFYGLTAALLAYVVVEAGAGALFWLGRGQRFSFATVRQQRSAVLTALHAKRDSANKQTEVGHMTMAGFLVPHPYLGYVVDPTRSGYHRSAVNSLGFGGSSDPLRRSPGEIVVGVTGGSVANFFFVDSADTLKAYLLELPFFRGKAVRMELVGAGGYHQPQQVMAVNYYLFLGGQLDVLINIDGYNELFLAEQNRAGGVSPIYPFNWKRIVKGQMSREEIRALEQSLSLEDRRYAVARIFDALDFSITCNTAWALIDELLEQAIARRAAVLTAPNKGDESSSYHLAGPAALREIPAQGALRADAKAWANGSAQLYGLGKVIPYRYFHFLQPNQYVKDSKPLSEQEQKRAVSSYKRFGEIVTKGYPLLRMEMLQLRAQGVQAHDLTGVFGGETRTVYTDFCCHMNKLGNDLMARAIADVLAKGLSPSGDSSSPPCLAPRGTF